MSKPKNLQFRDILRAIVPPWLSDKGHLSNSAGFKLLYSFGSTLDGFMEWFTQGAQARMPGVGTPTATPLISKDRQIVLGPFYNPTTHIPGLIRWLDAWKHVGHPFELLRQIRRYIGSVRCRTVDNSGNWHTIEEDGTETYVNDTDWDWDGDAASWARLWVIIYAPSTWAAWESFDITGTYSLWSSLLNGNGSGWQSTPYRPYHYTIGQQGQLYQDEPYPLYEVAEHVRALVKQWKPQHAIVPSIIIAFDPNSFNPLDSSSYPTDGTWGNWTKDSPAVPSRNSTARYWKGVD